MSDSLCFICHSTLQNFFIFQIIFQKICNEFITNFACNSFFMPLNRFFTFCLTTVVICINVPLLSLSLSLLVIPYFTIVKLYNIAWHGIEIVNIIAVIIKSMHIADDASSIDERIQHQQPASVTIKFSCPGQIFGVKISKNLSTHTEKERERHRERQRKLDGKWDESKNK